jgi:hypothetical protein
MWEGWEETNYNPTPHVGGIKSLPSNLYEVQLKLKSLFLKTRVAGTNNS